MEFDEDPRGTIILRKPFVVKADMMIYVNEGKINLHLYDLVIKFSVEKLVKKPTIDGQFFLA